MADVGLNRDITRLVSDHHEAVYRYAYRLTGSAADAEDLAQEVFLAGYQRLDQLRNPDCARGWLFAILRNLFLKAAQRPRAVSATTAGLNLDLIASPVGEKESLDGEALQEALNGLPPEFRMVLTMFYFEECSYREIAEQLDVPIGTVMSRLARAKGHLRARLLEPEPAISPSPTDD